MLSLKGRICVLREDAPFSKWQGHSAPSIDGTWPAGTPVKVVMVSRFWDVGITDDLGAENGYHARVSPGILTWEGITPADEAALAELHQMYLLQQAADAEFVAKKSKKRGNP